MQAIDLNGRRVGPGHSPYIIAEIGSNYNGDMALCKELIDAAKACGADAVKFQSWSSKTLISRAEYQRNTDYADKKRHFGSLYEMVEKYQFTPEQHHEVAAYCQSKNIHFLSSAFAPEEVDLLVEVKVPAIKIASMDVTHPVLLEHAAQSGKPVILSTGMATLAELDEAVSILKENGCTALALLHCISIYPPKYEDIHLYNLPMLQETFGLPVGFSDHSIGTAIPIAAVALGACIIEKHFTLDKDMDGWDHWISADPSELEVICREAKNVHLALGNRVRSVTAAELEKRKKFRRCIVLKAGLKKGHVLSLADLDFKRPGAGIHPNQYPYVLGRSLKHDLEADHELSWSDLV
jgi:N,N'-diacetyllegionaminate synthase